MTQVRLLNLDNGLSPWQPTDNNSDVLKTEFVLQVEGKCQDILQVSQRQKTKHTIDVSKKLEDDTLRGQELGKNCGDSSQKKVTCETDTDDYSHPMCNFGNLPSVEKLKTISAGVDRTCFCCNTEDEGPNQLSGWHNLSNDGGNQWNGKLCRRRKLHANVFSRLSGDSKLKPFVFNHYSDGSQYIEQYRRNHTVGGVGKEIGEPPKFGIDVPDPYALKIKNICSIADSCDFRALVPTEKEMSCSDIRFASPQSSCSGSGSDKHPAENSNKKVKDKDKTKSNRNFPSLAPVREKNPDGQEVLFHNKQFMSLTPYLNFQVPKSYTLPHIRTKLTDSLSVKGSGSRSLAGSTSGFGSLAESRIESVSSAISGVSGQGMGETKSAQQQKNIASSLSFFKRMREENNTALKISEFFSAAILEDDSIAFKTDVSMGKTTIIDDVIQEQLRYSHKEKSNCCNRKAETMKYKQTRRKIQNRRKQRCAKVISVTLDDLSVRGDNVKGTESVEPITTNYRLNKNKRSRENAELMSVAR